MSHEKKLSGKRYGPSDSSQQRRRAFKERGGSTPIHGEGKRESREIIQIDSNRKLVDGSKNKGRRFGTQYNHILNIEKNRIHGESILSKLFDFKCK